MNGIRLVDVSLSIAQNTELSIGTDKFGTDQIFLGLMTCCRLTHFAPRLFGQPLELFRLLPLPFFPLTPFLFSFLLVFLPSGQHQLQAMQW